ncbi:response regulator [Pedomonas mirosovicensis]|uniref:response regulator n=1 Tax=Pedomonas mirosovicensis TaxID=2908641 RepID=UPI00216A5286|nr:response regulator [Pedomonas mirosovicensis]MCH8685188.1 response regulator [Pedomonas mirosovicensis]
MRVELQGLRVLFVEDESIVAMLTEDMLADLGCEISAIAGTVEDALAAVSQGGFDIALLDINLAGVMVFPVAAALDERGIPFAFASGYGGKGVPPEFTGVPIIGKPFRIDDLAWVLQAALVRNRKKAAGCGEAAVEGG